MEGGVIEKKETMLLQYNQKLTYNIEKYWLQV